MRTQVTSVEQSTYNKMWRVCFTTFKGVTGDEYVSNVCESAPVFASETEAVEGGKRALELLNATDRFPNMCEAF